MALYQAFHEQLEEVISQEAYEGNALRYLNLRLWLKHRIEQRPLLDIVRESEEEL